MLLEAFHYLLPAPPTPWEAPRFTSQRAGSRVEIVSRIKRNREGLTLYANFMQIQADVTGMAPLSSRNFSVLASFGP